MNGRASYFILTVLTVVVGYGLAWRGLRIQLMFCYNLNLAIDDVIRDKESES